MSHTATRQDSSALTNIQVVEICDGLAGSLSGMLFADFGAEVIKVEPPGGDTARNDVGFVVWNRGKKSLVIDPNSKQQCSYLAELAAGADVCITRDSGTLARYGLSAEQLRADHQQLVILETPPFSVDNAWLGNYESNGLLAARSGLAWRQSSDDGNPVEWVIPQFTMVQGIWSAVCAIAALIERERSGHGQRVTVPGLSGVMIAAAAALTTTAGEPDPTTKWGSAGRHPLYTSRQGRDGKWLACGGLGAKFETIVLKAIGLGWMLEEDRMEHSITGLLKADNIRWATDLIVEAFLQRDRDEWLKLLTDLGVPCAPVDSPDHWLDHPQVNAIGMRIELEDPERGLVCMPGIPVRLTKTPGAVASPPPRLGEHANLVQPRMAESTPDSKVHLAPGPLAGTRVLDLGTFVAGPFAGLLLAELGADVVKVEPLEGDPFRASALGYNRGMRSLAIDLKSKPGREAFCRVASNSDVIINSLRPGAAEKLRIDYQSLTEVNPQIISLGISTFGPVGPLAQEPGFDVILQAYTGMMVQQGGNDDPVANTLALIDTTTSVFTTLAAALALFHKARTNVGQETWCSLTGSATMLQAAALVRFQGRPPARRGGHDFRGRDPFDRFYESANGWVRVYSPTPIAAADLQGAGIAIDLSEFEADPALSLEAAIRPLNDDDAVRMLEHAGIAAVKARKISQVQADEGLLEAEFTHIHAADGGASILTPGRYARFSRSQRRGPLRAAGAGEHSDAVLREAGMRDDEIQALVESKAVVRGEPMVQRLSLLYR